MATWTRLMATLAVAFAILASGTAQADEASADGLGYYPSDYTIAEALRGQRYQFKTTLVNDTTETRIFVLETSGGIAEWLNFAEASAPETPVEMVTVPAREKRDLWVYVQVPQSAANGTYEGVNHYDGYTEKDYTERKGVVLGFQQHIVVKVTGTQHLDLQVVDVFAHRVEAGQLLRVSAQVTNKGNIDVTPVLVLAISTGAMNIANAQLTTQVVRPAESTTVEGTWETRGQPPGTYHARYRVLAQGIEARAGEFDFEILPVGALTRSGQVLGVEFPEGVTPRRIEQADVRFKNTGQTASMTRFIGHIYRGETIIDDVTHPNDILARSGEEVTLNVFFSVPEEGRYEFRGRVTFDGAQTEEVVRPFTAGSTAPEGSSMVKMLGGSALLMLIAAGFVLRLRKPGGSSPANRPRFARRMKGQRGGD